MNGLEQTTKIDKWFLSSKLFVQKENRSMDDKKQRNTKSHCSTQTTRKTATKSERISLENDSNTENAVLFWH